MMIRKILQRASNWAHSLSHFGKLGRSAAQRAFLKKEKRKLLVKLGERTAEWVHTHPEAPPEVRRVVEQIQKIDAMMSKLDYGGKEGVDFAASDEGSKKRPAKRRASRQD
ncbi:MAG: hypothetical protein K8R69_04035 [Deltaproteobacteria bacterium]|nr:hypothetical protein [Deltaproteobacteria bacterium]